MFLELGLDDYPSIVKKPMDLSTVKTKLAENRYSSVQDCLNDIQLIWDNCRAYNADGSVKFFFFKNYNFFGKFFFHH
jgi:hypothetical protein